MDIGDYDHRDSTTAKGCGAMDALDLRWWFHDYKSNKLRESLRKMLLLLPNIRVLQSVLSLASGVSAFAKSDYCNKREEFNLSLQQKHCSKFTFRY